MWFPGPPKRHYKTLQMLGSGNGGWAEKLLSLCRVMLCVQVGGFRGTMKPVTQPEIMDMVIP